jgi:hypothetical protein
MQKIDHRCTPINPTSSRPQGRLHLCPAVFTHYSYHFMLITIHINFVKTRYIASLQGLYFYQAFCEMVSPTQLQSRGKIKRRKLCSNYTLVANWTKLPIQCFYLPCYCSKARSLSLSHCSHNLTS